MDIADLNKMGEDWWEHRINELDDIEKRKELLNELDALKEKVTWYERQFGKRSTATAMYYWNSMRYATSIAEWNMPFSMGTYSKDALIGRQWDVIHRLRMGHRIKVKINPDPWIHYALEDAYQYLNDQGHRPEVVFLCLVKAFGWQKVAIGKLFYEPKRLDKRNKKPGHEPDDSTYIRNFDKIWADVTNRYVMKI